MRFTDFLRVQIHSWNVKNGSGHGENSRNAIINCIDLNETAPFAYKSVAYSIVCAQKLLPTARLPTLLRDVSKRYCRQSICRQMGFSYLNCCSYNVCFFA